MLHLENKTDFEEVWYGGYDIRNYPKTIIIIWLYSPSQALPCPPLFGVS
jgi:hypothetical protein